VKLDARAIGNYTRRGVEALESIAASLKKDATAPTQLTTNVYNPDQDAVSIYRRTKQLLGNIKGETVPAFFLNGRGDEEPIDLDNEAAQGFARIESDGIYIKMSPEYYPALIRQIIAEGEPAAISIRLHHRRPLS
jgi:hypothetical protein